MLVRFSEGFSRTKKGAARLACLMGYQNVYVTHQARRRGSYLITIAAIIYILFIYTYLRHQAKVQLREEKFPTFGYNEEDLSEFVSFMSPWCKQSERRLDWAQILKPCENNTVWGKQNQFYTFRNQTNTKKTFLNLWDIKPAGQFSRIGIQTVTNDGRIKNFGGDSWRVHVRGPITVSPTVIDHNNGSYEILFLAVYPGNYRIYMVLEYSLCDGYKEPPVNWFIKGNSQGKYQPLDALPGFEKPYLISSLWEGTPIKITIPSPRRHILHKLAAVFPSLKLGCGIKCRYLGSGEGYWLNDRWIPFTRGEIKRPHEKNKGTLWIYGDSNGDFFYKLIQNRPLCKQTFLNCNRTYNWVYRLPNANQTIGRILNDDLDFDVDRILREISEVLIDTAMRNNNQSVIILNLGLHYVQNANFTKYRELIDRTIKLFQGGESGDVGNIGKSFKGQMIWKTTTAMNREKYGDPRTGARHSKGIRFLTYQRLLLYNAYATKAMCDAGFDILDVFPLTDSFINGTGLPHKPFDAVHYPIKTLLPAVQLLERYFEAT